MSVHPQPHQLPRVGQAEPVALPPGASYAAGLPRATWPAMPQADRRPDAFLADPLVPESRRGLIQVYHFPLPGFVPPPAPSGRAALLLQACDALASLGLALLLLALAAACTFVRWE